MLIFLYLEFLSPGRFFSSTINFFEKISTGESRLTFSLRNLLEVMNQHLGYQNHDPVVLLDLYLIK